ncbi:hypothetical protein GF323_04740 [Candidatus Woesearchaeota archaeon]|nr:hypothetical protein [Candidatus Woesearchaeota archaeon]
MEEKIIVFVAFLGSLAGILILFSLSESLDYDIKTIEKINSEKMQDMIKINGKVIEVNSMENITFIRVQQPSYIDVIVFDNMTVPAGTRIEVIGQSEEYQNKMEIIAHRIRVIEKI